MRGFDTNTATTLEGENSQTYMRSLNSDSLKILYYSTRSLITKIDELRILHDVHRPKVVCIVETWFDENITDTELTVNNYQVIRLDRNRHGGGVLMYVHNSLSYKITTKGQEVLLYCSLYLCFSVRNITS